MRRKAVFAALAWGLGLAACYFLPAGKDYLMIPLVITAVLILKLAVKLCVKGIVVLVIVFALAVGFYRGYEHFDFDKIIEQNGIESLFEGSVENIDEYGGDMTAYTVKGELNGISGVRLRLCAPSCDCSVGDTVRFFGVPERLSDDYVFQSGSFYKTKGIFLSCDKFSRFEVGKDGGFSLYREIYEYRENVKSLIRRRLPESEGALICGMLFGDKSGLSQDDKTLFYRTGIGHVMAVSGLHLVLFCAVFSYLFGLMRLSKYKRFIFLEILMLIFASVSGLSSSVLRAALMMTLVYAAPLFNRQTDCASSVSIAFIILTLPNPFSIADPSLILSVAGALSAGVFAPYMTAKMKTERLWQKALKHTTYMLCVSVGIFPASVMLFGEASLFAPIANIILVPLCMAALALSIAFAALFFAEPVFLIKAAGVIAGIVLYAVRLVGRLSFSGVSLSSEAVLLTAFLTAVCVLTLLISKKRRWGIVSILSSATVLSASVSLSAYADNDAVKIAVLGKNRTDVIAATAGGHTVILDITGNKDNYRYALKFLQRNNIMRADALILIKKPYNAVSCYSSGFELIETGEIFIENDTELGSAIAAENVSFEDFHRVFGDIEVSIRGGEAAVRYGSFDLVCSDEPTGEEPEVFCGYGRSFSPVRCSALIAPGADSCEEGLYTDSNVVVSADRDGRYSIEGAD